MQSFFVLGHPVAHSKSPVMHNAAYQALGLPWTYGRADCPTESEARAFLAGDAWLGLNVTTPYKPLAFEVASWRSQAAVVARGANVLARCGCELRADNTDGAGCVAFLRHRGITLQGARAIVCGTGPTSLSIAFAFSHAGASEVLLLGRSGKRARQVVAGLRTRCASAGIPLSTLIHAGDYESCARDIAQADIVVDATPLGMAPGDPSPFDTTVLSAGQVVLDTVYGHGETALLAAARAVGCVAFDGTGMLVGQAVETVRDFAMWLHAPLDEDAVDLFAIMSQAVENRE